MKNSKIVYPQSYTSKVGEVIEGIPCFVDTNTIPWVNEVENQYQIIYAELQQFLESKKTDEQFISRYPSVTEGYWGRLDVKFWNMLHPNAKYFQKTIDIMAASKSCTRITFNLLKPHSRIKPHNGENDAYYRGHLALKIPGKLPNVGFQVGNESRSWEEGKILLFLDAQNHQAFNDSDETRIIMVFDVWLDKYKDIQDDATLHNISAYSVSMIFKILTNELAHTNDGRFLYFVGLHEVEKFYSKEQLTLYRLLNNFYRSTYHENRFTDTAQDFFWGLWDKCGGI